MSAVRMEEDEWKAFVLEGTRTAKLATTRADGSPHVTPVCFTLEGGDVVFSTDMSTVKAKAMLRDSRVAVCVDDERPPFRYVMLRGSATVDSDPAAVRGSLQVLGTRYLGADRARVAVMAHAKPGAVIVRVRVEEVVAWRYR